MPRMRGRLYSSCASSTWSLPSARDGVLGEDVEDQLRAVDDARVERVLERPLLGRIELVVDEEHFRLPTPRTRASAPRACPCRHRFAGRAGPGAGRARRPARRPPCARARAARRAPRPRRRPAGTRPRAKPRSGSAPGSGSGWRCVTRRIMPRPVQNPRVPLDLAARTLELVDVPSVSRHEQRLAELVRASVPLDARLRRRSTLLFRRRGGRAAARRLRRPPRHRPGERQPAGPDRRRRGARARRERHEGRPRGDGGAGALGRGRGRAGARSGVPLLSARGDLRGAEPAARGSSTPG